MHEMQTTHGEDQVKPYKSRGDRLDIRERERCSCAGVEGSKFTKPALKQQD